ncbi:hypothetical protein ABIC84_005308 [Mucilaginibacter sp. 3215]
MLRPSKHGGQASARDPSTSSGDMDFAPNFIFFSNKKAARRGF